MFLTLVFFILALFLLVTIHEYGHFQVARWCGVKVLRFSFGFGPVIARCRSRSGTEFVWSLLPFGGYVKMLDEQEAPVPEHEKHLAFNNQKLWKKLIIVLAGPLFNFLFAFFALWLVLIIGIHTLAPIVQSVKPYSIAANAGIKSNQEIVSMDGNPINSWRDFQYRLMPLLGSKAETHVELKSLQGNQHTAVVLPLSDWTLNEKKPDPLESLGIIPFIPVLPAVVGEIVPNSPASQVDLKIHDLIIKIDELDVKDWLNVVEYVQRRPSTLMQLQVMRGKQLRRVSILSGARVEKGETKGFLGVQSQKVNWPEHWLRIEKKQPLQAVVEAASQTMQLTKTTFILMGRLLTGKLGLKTISGPVGIAQGAGDSGRSGLVTYLFFLALVSISLGSLNLLPVPMLDGGHLLYYIIEMVTRRPVTEKFKTFGTYLGIILLMMVMFIAFTNDISRILNG